MIILFQSNLNQDITQTKESGQKLENEIIFINSAHPSFVKSL